MAENQRRLMPYEHQLVEALGITKDEYLDFVAQQQIYSDPKQGTTLDIRNDLTVVAIVLTIIGTILQVAAALLAKPIEGGGQRQQTRDDVFAPRSGFNSVQELASFGDPVNLVYTNTSTNSNGGVRVATSLLWSSIKSFGSSQYIQLLLLVGAGGMGRIDYDRAAFGQTPVRDLIAQNYWLYFRPNGTGAIRISDRVAGGEGEADPGAVGPTSGNLYRIFPSNTSSAGDGFSHAISPATSNTFGVYGPIPINADIVIREQSGNPQAANNQIIATGLARWGAASPSSTNGAISVGENLTITLRSTSTRSNDIEVEEAQEQRRALATVFDNAAIFKLGSAQFSVVSSSRGSTDEGDVVVRLRCVRSGLAPSTPYGANTAEESKDTLVKNSAKYIDLDKRVTALLAEDGRFQIKNATDLLNSGSIYSGYTWKAAAKGGIGSGLPTFKRYLTADEKAILREYINLGSSESIFGDDRFFTKALVKVEISSYETLSPCHIVDLAIKARVSRRISGRQEKYGTKERKGYPISDNGLKMRSAMFLVKYKKARDASFSYVKGVFVVRRATDVDNYIYIRFNSGGFGLDSADSWRFELEPIHDSIAEIKSRGLEAGGVTKFFYLENSGSGQSVSLGSGRTISFTGAIVNSSNMLPPRNKSPRDTNEWDLFSNTADTQLQMSFDNGPEFSLTAVTEQIRDGFSSYPGLYSDISLLGFNLYSGRNVQDLRSLSVFVEQGRRSRLLRTSGTVSGIAWGQPNYQYLSPTANGYANTAPDIFVDTILDVNDGIGRYAGDLFSIDLEQLARSKKFCERNRLFMDGVIADPTSWRQFWANNAPFSLLELAKTDGKESLIPAMPYNKSTGQIADRESNIAVAISALFNQGNILEDSYKEEFIDYGTSTEDVIVTAIYRENEIDGVFPRNNSVEVRLSSAAENNALRETIDLSSFVTNRSQAIMVAKFLCQTRRHSRRAIEFKTFPTDSYVGPGSYIYVELAQNQWNKIHSGTISDRGVLNLPLASNITNGTYQVLMYNPENQSAGTVFKPAVSVVSETASSLAAYEGYVFVLGQAVKNKRVFRVTEVAMDEEGEVAIRGIEHPVDADGYSLITRGLDQRVAGVFTIDGRAE